MNAPLAAAGCTTVGADEKRPASAPVQDCPYSAERDSAPSPRDHEGPPVAVVALGEGRVLEMYLVCEHLDLCVGGDVVQIPAFLCQQTSLLLAAGKHSITATCCVKWK